MGIPSFGQSSTTTPLKGFAQQENRIEKTDFSRNFLAEIFIVSKVLLPFVDAETSIFEIENRPKGSIIGMYAL